MFLPRSCSFMLVLLGCLSASAYAEMTHQPPSQNQMDNSLHQILHLSMTSSHLNSNTNSNPSTPKSEPNTPPLQQKTLTNTTNIKDEKKQQDAEKQLQLKQQRLNQLEQANLQALTQNQALQIKNDNLTGQVKVLQSERSAQMFLYGAATIVIGFFIGLLTYHLLYGRNRRKW